MILSGSLISLGAGCGTEYDLNSVFGYPRYRAGSLAPSGRNATYFDIEWDANALQRAFIAVF